MSTLPVLETYAALHEAIRQILRHGQERARQAVEQEKGRPYGEIGQELHTPFRQHQERAGYGEQVVARLAADLEVSERLLYGGLAL